MTEQIKVGDTIPSGEFGYVPYAPELDDNLACGMPIKFNTDEWKGKKIVVVSVPGAFTPTCHQNHLPPYLEKYEELKAKGVDEIYVLAVNDVFVMSGWGRAEGFKGKIVPITDTYGAWSAKMGLTQDLTAMGMGLRTSRYCLIIDDLRVISAEKEPARGVTNTGVEATLSKL